jgi:hypothetical protein
MLDLVCSLIRPLTVYQSVFFLQFLTGYCSKCIAYNTREPPEFVTCPGVVHIAVQPRESSACYAKQPQQIKAG